jgi:hypothetical protein
MPVYPEPVIRYLNRLHDPRNRRYACTAHSPDEVALWQAEARPVLRRLMGLDNIAASVGDHKAAVELGPEEDMGAYGRQLGYAETEPDVRVPFWLLRPKGQGPFPLAVTPHGHEPSGYDQYAGRAHDAKMLQAITQEDGDPAVRAVTEGFLAIAPATRGLGCDGVPDVNGRHGSRCESQLMHCLIVGRTAIGERVWDMERLLDWAISLPEVDPRVILMVGNSGGGMVTTYAAACDTRIQVAVPNCSFSMYVSRDGYIHHHDCNMIPGILQFGEFYDVAGLIAPRHLLTVNGSLDAFHPQEEVNRAVAGLQRIYQAAGAPERYSHRYGDGGHRFYNDLIWPYVREAVRELVGQASGLP